MGSVTPQMIQAFVKQAQALGHEFGYKLGGLLQLVDGEFLIPDPKAREMVQTALGLNNMLEFCLSAVDDRGKFQIPLGCENETAFNIELAKRYNAVGDKVKEELQQEGAR